MFLESRFKEVIWRRPNLKGISYKVLEEEESLFFGERVLNGRV